MEERPKIKLHLSLLDRNIETAGSVFLFIMWILALYSYFNMPGVIPVHFDVAGNANRFGSKETILLLPVLGTVIFLGLTQLNKYPHIFNYMVKITVDNADRQYTLATRTIRLLKLAILIIFTLIILFTYLNVIGIANGLGFWFLPLTIGLFLIPTMIMLIKSFKEK